MHLLVRTSVTGRSPGSEDRVAPTELTIAAIIETRARGWRAPRPEPELQAVRCIVDAVPSQEVAVFMLANLPSVPARVLEVGAGDGELARLLTAAGYDVVAIDPGASTDNVVPIGLVELEEPDGSFDAAVAVVSLHHVDPLDDSCNRLADVLRPGATLLVDEFDVERYDERAAEWWLEQRRARSGRGALVACGWFRHGASPVCGLVPKTCPVAVG